MRRKDCTFILHRLSFRHNGRFDMNYLNGTEYFVLTDPLKVLGRAIVIHMRDGACFGFQVKELYGRALRGYDHDGQWLQIDIDDIVEVRFNKR